MKKKLLCLLGLLLLLQLFLPKTALAEGAPPASDSEGTLLSAREDGSFRILLVADTQDTDRPQPAMLELLNAALDAADADLVLFMGDVIYGPSIGKDAEKVAAAIDAVVTPVVERGLPFAVAFGNHDDQDSISKEEQFAIYRSYPGCLNAEEPGLPGCGNTCLLLRADGSAEPSIALWVMDSGTYAEDGSGYGNVTEEQNEWFRGKIAALCEELPAPPVSYVFQHIPVPQVFELTKPATIFTRGAFTKIAFELGPWYVADETRVWDGRFGETPCPSAHDSGQFLSWKDCGVKAAFFAHDHTNDYCGTVEGIDLIATTGIGFYSYGRGNEHGARLLVLYPADPSGYDTQMLYRRDLTDAPLPPLLIPSLGAQLQGPVLLALGWIAALILLGVILLRRRHRRKRK